MSNTPGAADLPSAYLARIQHDVFFSTKLSLRSVVAVERVFSGGREYYLGILFLSAVQAYTFKRSKYLLLMLSKKKLDLLRVTVLHKWY